jgi:phosphoribulokinase
MREEEGGPTVVQVVSAMSRVAHELKGAGVDAGESRRRRPVMVGIVGDSAAGKTTLTRGIANIFGQQRVTVVCADDYHRYDREARARLQVTPLNPECNYLGILEQHLQLMALGETVLKPVYNHKNGGLDAPELVVPSEIVLVEGLLGLHTKAMRDCLDVKVYLDPPEELRRQWKVERDCAKRGYEPDEVLRQLEEREGDSEAFIRPQRENADIIVSFSPPEGVEKMDRAHLDVKLVLRPTLPHPYLLEIADQTQVDEVQPVRLSLSRDHNKPVDVLEIEGHIAPEVSGIAESLIWGRMNLNGAHLDREAIGTFQENEQMRRSESLALTQLLLVFQLMSARVIT